MRLRAVLLIALCAVLCDAGPRQLVADPQPAPLAGAGLIMPVPAGDTRCPAATNALFTCSSNPGAYLVFEKVKGMGKNNLCRYVSIYGETDFDTCPGYRLIHVRRVAKPLAPPPPCDFVDCPPPQP